METVSSNRGRIQEIISKVPKGVPVVMLNMLKFWEVAKYKDGSRKISGKETYGKYSEEESRHVKKIGGKMIWYGQAHTSVIGPPYEDWDHISLVWYAG